MAAKPIDLRVSVDDVQDSQGHIVQGTVSPRNSIGAAGQDAVQRISVNAAGGVYTLECDLYGMTETTAALPWDASAYEVQTALDALPNIARGDGWVDVESAGGAGNYNYVVKFEGADSGENVPTMIAHTEGLLNIGNTISTAYDADGEITSIGDNFSHYAYTYDGQGNVSSVDNAGTPGVPDVLLSSQYDTAGNRSSLAATIGGVKDFLNSYSYDTLSRMTMVQQQAQTGGNGVSPKEIDYAYNGVGQVTARVAYNFIGTGPRPDIATAAYSYNTNDLLSGLDYTGYGGADVFDNFSYTYDTLARVATFGSIDGTATYGYDPTSQIVSASYTTAPGGTQPPSFSATYDPNGNRTATDGTSTTVGADNHLSSDGTFNFTFDAAGNLASRIRISNASANDYKTVYDWDYRNRLTDVDFYNNSGTLTQHVHYVYDVWDHLIERDLDPTGGGTFTEIVHYVWDGDNIVLAFNGQDQLTTRYLNGPNTSAYDQFFSTLAEEDLDPNQPGAAGVTTYPILDNQGSVRDVVDANGNVVGHIVYTAFGAVAYTSNPSAPHLTGFQGGYTDPATGEVLFGHRWEEMVDAFWLSQDPMQFAAGDTNLSRADGNGPTNEIDPSGLEHFPSDSRGTWVQGTKGNGVFEYSDTAQNRAAGLAGKRVRFENNCIGLGGFPADVYYRGSADAATVPIAKVKGTTSDFTAADAAMREKLGNPNWKRPAGYTWNHAGSPGSQSMELVRRGPHGAVAHTGSASAPRAAQRAGRVGSGMARALAAGTVYMGFRDACQAAGAAQPDYQEVAEEYYFTDDDGSVFTVREPGFLGSFVTSPWKNYVAGPSAGQTEEITPQQVQQYRDQAEAKYGKYNPGTLFREPTFTPGTDRTTLPVTRGLGGPTIGHVDEDGVHITRPWAPDCT